MFKFILLSLLISLSAMAQSPGWTAVTAGKVDITKKAVLDSINAKSFSCSGTVVENGVSRKESLLLEPAKTYIETANGGVWVKSDSSQPLLAFEDLNDDGYTIINSTIYVFTSADRKTVTSLGVEQTISVKSVQNVGTIDNPNYQNISTLKTTITGNCQ